MATPREPSGRSLNGERDFRWRATEVSRIEAFSDAVFALTLTLLVVSTEVPRSWDGLLVALYDFVPFGVTFVLLCLIWHEHYLFFRRFGLHDAASRVWNLGLLLLVLFYVYPLKFLFRWLVDLVVSSARGDGMPTSVPLDRIDELMVVYGLGYASVFGVLAVLYRHAWRLRDALELDPVERVVTRGALEMHSIQTGFGLCSCALALAVPAPLGAMTAGFVYCGVGPVLTLHGRAVRRRAVCAGV